MVLVKVTTYVVTLYEIVEGGMSLVYRVLERSAPRRGDPEQQSETRRAPGAALRKLRRSTTQRCTPKMAGAHLAPQ